MDEDLKLLEGLRERYLSRLGSAVSNAYYKHYQDLLLEVEGLLEKFHAEGLSDEDLVRVRELSDD